MGAHQLVWQPGDLVAAMPVAWEPPVPTWQPARRAKANDGLHANSQHAASHEKALAAGLLACWRDFGASLDQDALLAAIEPRGLPGLLLEALTPNALAVAQTAVLEPVVHKVARQGVEIGLEPLADAGVAVTQLGKAGHDIVLALNAVNPEAVRYAKQRAAALVEADAATRARIRKLIVESQEDGISPDELARLIRGTIGLTDGQTEAVETFRHRLTLRESIAAAVQESRVLRYADALLKYRAETIARTETIAALNAGQAMLWKEAVAQRVIRPQQFDKVWIVADDELLCDECEENGAEPVGMDEDFTSGDEHPPAHPNCRCAMGLVNKGGD